MVLLTQVKIIYSIIIQPHLLRLIYDFKAIEMYLFVCFSVICIINHSTSGVVIGYAKKKIKFIPLASSIRQLK
jgi:hypothetical protein